LEDNAGLFHALSSGLPVLPVFIFDREILDHLEEKADRRVKFLYSALVSLQEKLIKSGSSLLARHTHPEVFFQKLVTEYSIHTVFTNHDYEPYARERDKNIKTLLSKNNIEFKTYKDQVIFEKDEVIKNDGGFYTV